MNREKYDSIANTFASMDFVEKKTKETLAIATVTSGFYNT
jgi:hypothetical protein